MRSFWRKLCGLALGVALLPSLAGGGACLEHAVHALSGTMAAGAGEDTVHDAGAAAPLGNAHSEHAAHVTPASGELRAARGVASNVAHHVAITPDAHADHALTGIVSVSEAPASDCCPPMASTEHCAGAAGCSVSAVAMAADLATQPVLASRVIALAGAVAPPGPARAPDVPPPRA